MNKLFSLMLIVGLLLVAGCSEKQTLKITNKSVSSDNFVLEVTTSTTVNKGESLKIKGKIEYIGNKPLLVTHGEPIVRFHFTGSNEERGYTDRGYTTEFITGHVVEVEDQFLATKKGKQRLFVSVEGDLIKIEPFEIEVSVK